MSAFPLLSIFTNILCFGLHFISLNESIEKQNKVRENCIYYVINHTQECNEDLGTMPNTAMRVCKRLTALKAANCAKCAKCPQMLCQPLVDNTLMLLYSRIGGTSDKFGPTLLVFKTQYPINSHRFEPNCNESRNQCHKCNKSMRALPRSAEK